MKKLIALICIIICCKEQAFSAEIRFEREIARDLKLDENTRLYVRFSQTIKRYKLSGDLDKEFKISQKDSILNMFLVEGNNTLIVTRDCPTLLVLNENFELIDSIDTKKLGAFRPQEIHAVQKGEYVVYRKEDGKIKTYGYDFIWKSDVNYSVSSLGKRWFFVNGFGSGYRYFYSEDRGGIIKTDNNGQMHGFLPVGRNLFEFYTKVRENTERVIVYNGGSFVEANFDNLNDFKIMATIPTDGEITAVLLNEVVVKLYNHKLSIFNITISN